MRGNIFFGIGINLPIIGVIDGRNNSGRDVRIQKIKGCQDQKAQGKNFYLLFVFSQVDLVKLKFMN